MQWIVVVGILGSPMAQEKNPSHLIQSAFLRYALAILSVAIALGLSLFLDYLNVHEVEFPVFLLAITLTAWYAGTWPGIITLVLSALAFNYYFTEPRYSFYVTRDDVPYYIIFILFATLITWFSAIRRRVEQRLVQSRDELQREVAIRTQQANLLNLTHDPIFVRDMNGMITYWNRGAEELYGWTADQAVGRESHQLLGTIFPKPLKEIQTELLNADRWEGELGKKNANGTSVLVASRWSLQRDPVGNPIAVLESENDITERRRREDEIRGLNQELAKRSTELEATNKELEAFAYSVSHDLRAPLRHMGGYAELLQKNAGAVLNEKSQRYLTLILHAAKRMGNLIDDLLAFSRIGRVDTQKTLINLDQLFKEVLSEMKQDLEGRNITWKVTPLPACYGDRSMLRLVLVNLLSNALKFTRGRTRAEIEVGWNERGHNEVTVFVKDNGAGFDMKYVDKLFGVFQRLHQPDEFEGTGIGLATVQRIIHRHGGQVRAEGAVDHGATFYFSVPKA